jgi:Methyltransferase domain
METFVMTGNGSDRKAAAIVDGLSAIWSGTIVDVGCRTREFARALGPRDVRCVGVDLDGSADVLADLGVGLPFADCSAHVVVALDVLEHTERIHDSFAELCRVATDHIVIALPNEYDVKHRWLAVRGRHSGKWGLPLEATRDRHRWIFTLAEARAFCVHLARAHGWHLIGEHALIGPRRDNGLGRVLLRAWPSVFCPTYVAVLAAGDPAEDLRLVGS